MNCRRLCAWQAQNLDFKQKHHLTTQIQLPAMVEYRQKRNKATTRLLESLTANTNWYNWLTKSQSKQPDTIPHPEKYY